MIATTANTWNLGLSAKRRLVERLRQGNSVIPFSDEPALASLCACLALQREMGNREFDRLSPFFGVELAPRAANPWESEIFQNGAEIGIRFVRRDGRPLTVRHADFAVLLAPESLGDDGELRQAVIYPQRVAERYRQRGFELVIVRDWILSSALALDEENHVSYLLTNEWEIQQNISRQQVELMTKRQLPFFGTHDIVDHLLGANVALYEVFRDLYLETKQKLDCAFASPSMPSRSRLILSYLIGVLLDDLAQPKWYGSAAHAGLVRYALAALKNAPPVCPASEALPKTLPGPFHELMEALRAKTSAPASLRIRFEILLTDLFRAPLQSSVCTRPSASAPFSA